MKTSNTTDKTKYHGSGLPLDKTRLPQRPGLGPSARVLRAGASFVSEMSGLLSKLCVLMYVWWLSAHLIYKFDIYCDDRGVSTKYFV